VNFGRVVSHRVKQLYRLGFTEQAFTFAGDAHVRKVEHYQLSVDALKMQPGGGTGA
jgi:hypothetical protein